MCGIYGITKKDVGLIQGYINTCSYRGPDGSHIWSDEYVTLGHNLLAITSEPLQGRQPWITDKGNILIYNGEIFNYQELISAYNLQPKTSCDTELLAFLLDQDGINSTKVIDSMHAFAYYDQMRKTITLSRDHAGIKPLFYAETSDGLIFGSEIKGMLDHVPNSRCMDAMAAAAMSYSGSNATRNTMFTNIKKVLPGETLVYSIHHKKFITKDRTIITPVSNGKLDLEEFRTQSHETVKMCTLGLRKFGMFLSGGLDSTLVAYELKKILGELDSFTNEMNPNVIIGENFNDDANCAKKFADDFGLNHHRVEITPSRVEEYWDQAIYSMEQPIYNPSMSMYYYTNKFLSEKDVVVTMAGDMGDELLGGYPKYFKLRKDMPKSFPDLVWKWMHRIKRPIKLSTKIDKNDVHNELCKTIPEILWNDRDPINSYMAVDCVTQVPEEFFSRNDQYGMRFSMEGRFPLATKKFMRYCLNIHSDYKIGENKAQTKLPTKVAYKGILPDYIINKEKTGWTVPSIYWISSNKNLEQLAMKCMNGNDCLKNIVGMDNWDNKKTRIVSWMMRSWAHHYKLISK
jgi:asparagine synthase (glutamine-hydrolysing)